MLKLILALLEELTALRSSNRSILDKLEAIQNTITQFEERQFEIMANQAETQAAVDALSARLDAVATEQTTKVLPGIQTLVSEAQPVNLTDLTNKVAAVEAASAASDAAANPAPVVPPTPPTA